MQYNSWLYLFPFLGGSIILYYLIPVKCRWIGLLFSSLLFYILAMKNLVAVVLFTTATIYLGARTIEEFNEQFKLKKKELDRAARKELKSKITKKNRYVIALLCVINFGILFITKYFNFFGENINALFHALHISAQIPFLDIFLPLGISFYTLSAISYVTDVARGVCKAEKNYFRLLLFLIFFPIITEGPISRYGQLGEELKAEHHFDYKQFCFGAQLIVWGLFQKVLLSDRVNMYVRAIFANHEKYSGFPVIMAILLYTFQLYMDFAGCINIARGSAQLFGITLEENFKRPFFATSVNEFWRRWHISLSSWFRDYVYIPLGGNRVSKIKHIRNLLIVWFLTGLWHGAAWNFVAWGLYYGVILIIEKYLLSPVLDRLPDIVRHIYSIVLVVIGWVLFFSSSFGQAADYIRVMFGAGAHGFADRESMYLLTSNLILWLILIFGSTPLVHFRYEHMLRTKKWNTTIINSVVYAALFIVCIAYLVTETYNPFLYFRF